MKVTDRQGYADLFIFLINCFLIFYFTLDLAKKINILWPRELADFLGLRIQNWQAIKLKT